MRNLKLTFESPCMAVESAGVEKSGFVVVSNECIGGLNCNKDVHLSGNVKGCVIKIGDAQRLHNWLIHGKPDSNR